MRPARNYLRLPRYKIWCPEKCSHLRLALFRGALRYLSYRGNDWCPRQELHLYDLAATAFSTLRVCCFTTRANWCLLSDSNREDSVFETPMSADCIKQAKWCATQDSNLY
jgi:hypothetical protein